MSFPKETQSPEVKHLTNALSSIKTEAERSLGHPVDAEALSLPKYWNDTTRTAALQAARNIGFSVNGPHMVPKYPNAARYAYNLSSKQNDEHYLIIVDYNADHFHRSFCEVAGPACIVEGQVYLPNRGEKRPSPADSVNRERPLQSVYSKALTMFLEYFPSKTPARISKRGGGSY